MRDTSAGLQPHLKRLKLDSPVSVVFRQSMSDRRTIITHTVDAETLVLRDGLITEGVPLKLASLQPKYELDLNSNDFNIAVMKFKASSLAAVMRRYSAHFGANIQKEGGACGAAKFFIAEFVGGALLVAHKDEFTKRLDAIRACSGGRLDNLTKREPNPHLHGHGIGTEKNGSMAESSIALNFHTEDRRSKVAPTELAVGFAVELGSGGKMDSDIISSSLITDSRKGNNHNEGKVLVVYSGGTIGSAPRDLLDPESPEVVYPWEELQESVAGLNNMPFPVDAISFREPLDSTNVGPRHWKAIAETVQHFHDAYAGFVIVHGTDTMVYTASALSFILQDLDKPVVITGSQIPALWKVRNDAEQNLITALLIAQYRHSKLPCVPEVSIFFRDRLLRGNRSKKLNASGYAAFDSLNYPPLGLVGDVIAIDRNAVREPSKAGFKIQPELNTNVVMFDMFPGLQDNSELCTALLGSKQIEGIVLKTYGSGNVPTKPVAFLEAIDAAVKAGKIVINVTQCVQGDVKQGLYDTSAVLQDMGVISGQDITPEAALCKLMNVLGDGDLSPTARKARMSRSLAGEQNYSMYTTVLDSESRRIDARKGEEGRYRSAAVVINGFSDDGRTIEKCLIRFIGASVLGAGKVLIKIFLNLASKAQPSENLSVFAGQYVKSQEQIEQTFTFDIAQTARQELKAESTLTVYVEPYTESLGELSWRRLELTLFLVE